MGDIGKLLIFFGVILIAAGALFQILGKVPWAGRLPGDIYIRKGSFSFYFPLATCLIISLVLTLLLSLFRRK